MKTLDVTFDFETCSLQPTAAVMRVGAVAWDRTAKDIPFNLPLAPGVQTEFYQHVDLRSAFLDGFTFDQSTANWWAQQNDEAKEALLENDIIPLQPLKEVVANLFDMIVRLAKALGVYEVYLWAQGTDFDVAILRNIAYKYNIPIPIKHTNYRDHRTFFLEGARMICDAANVNFDPRSAYKLVDEYNGNGSAHDPVFDCKRSIYSTWQMMKHLQCFKRQESNDA